MRKKVTLLILLMVGSLLCVQAQRKKVTSAEVLFDVSYKGVSDDDLPDLPTQVTYLISGSNTKQIVVTPKSVMRIIANADSSFLANLTDIGDDRVALVYYKDDIADASAGLEFTIKPTNDKMEILGYKCKKYEIDILNKETNEHMTDIVYATEAIGGANINFLMYKALKGFILRSEKTNGGETTIMEAKRVLKRPILDSEFLIPEVYTVTTYKEQKQQTVR
jgi:hypothetical protein